MALKSYKLKPKTALAKLNFDSISNAAFDQLGTTSEELKLLTKKFQGHIQLPGMPGYDQDSEGNPLYPEKPKIIAYCANWNDVRLALACAHTLNLWVTCRSGGHSTAGFSLNNGMVIDVSLLNAVVVDPNQMQMTVGSGATWGQINSILNTYQLHVTGGGCTTVGAAGYMQGGGYGFTARQFGMNSDNVIQVTVMLADGSIVTANETQNEDLFWAIRGGTGGNFGVLLEIKYKLYALYEVWGFGLKWDLAHAPAALVQMQTDFIKGSTGQNFNYQTVLGTVNYPDAQHSEFALAILGMYVGSREDGMKALAPLLQTEGVVLVEDQTDTYENLNDSLLNMLNPPDPSCVEFKHSGFIAQLPKLNDWQQIVDFFSTSPNKYNLLVIEPYGGAIDAFPADKSAFIHRDVYMDFFADSFFDEAGKFTTKDEAQEWINNFAKLATPLYNGHVYQNYPVRDFPNFRWAYWGDAYPTLLFVKNKYDPNNFFHFEQSISPYPEPNDQIQISTAKSLYDNPEIIYNSYSKHKTVKHATAKL